MNARRVENEKQADRPATQYLIDSSRMPGTCSKFALGRVVRARPAMLRLKAELVSSGKCKYVSINTATHAALVAAVEKKFQIRCCRLLCLDRVHIENDSDLAELREDDHILVYEKDAGGLAGVTDGEARLENADSVHQSRRAERRVLIPTVETMVERCPRYIQKDGRAVGSDDGSFDSASTTESKFSTVVSMLAVHHSRRRTLAVPSEKVSKPIQSNMLKLIRQFCHGMHWSEGRAPRHVESDTESDASDEMQKEVLAAVEKALRTRRKSEFRDLDREARRLEKNRADVPSAAASEY